MAVDGEDRIYVGSARYMEKLGHRVQGARVGTHVHIVKNDEWLGRIELMDALKRDARETDSCLETRRIPDGHVDR